MEFFGVVLLQLGSFKECKASTDIKNCSFPYDTTIHFYILSLSTVKTTITKYNNKQLTIQSIQFELQLYYTNIHIQVNQNKPLLEIHQYIFRVFTVAAWSCLGLFYDCWGSSRMLSLNVLMLTFVLPSSLRLVANTSLFLPMSPYKLSFIPGVSGLDRSIFSVLAMARASVGESDVSVF